MNRQLPTALALAALFTGAAPAAEPDDAGAMRGMRLYQNHCTVCHESTVHIREHRKAASIAEIGRWVRRWSGYLELGWNEDEVADVRSYLNSTYYNY